MKEFNTVNTGSCLMQGLALQLSGKCVPYHENNARATLKGQPFTLTWRSTCGHLCITHRTAVLHRYNPMTCRGIHMAALKLADD